MSLLEARNPDSADLLLQVQGVLDKEGKIDEAKIGKLQKQLDVRSFPRFAIESIDEQLQVRGKGRNGGLAVENKTLLRVKLKGGPEPLVHDVWVALVEGNYQILDVDTLVVP